MNISYYETNDGKWFKSVFPKQCGEKVFLSGKCQGLKGHKGVHWCYNASGCFCYDDNDKDSSEDGCSGTVPPGHIHYHKPEDMRKHYFMSFITNEEVTDPKEIERLKQEKLFDGESVDRPLSKEECEKIAIQAKDIKIPKPRENRPPKVG